MSKENQLGEIYTSLNLLIEEVRVLNSLLKPKNETSPEYYRILNPESHSRNDISTADNINQADRSMAYNINQADRSMAYSGDKTGSSISGNIDGYKGNSYYDTSLRSSRKKEKNLSLAYIQSSVSRDYLMKRLSYIAGKGRGREISKILNKYEAVTFSDLKPRYYKDVLREAEVLIR